MSTIEIPSANASSVNSATRASSLPRDANCDGHQFESPQLHQEVRASWHDFLRHRIARHSRGLRRHQSVCWDAAWPLGRRAGAGRRGDLSGLGRVELRQWPCALRRRRRDGMPLTGMGEFRLTGPTAADDGFAAVEIFGSRRLQGCGHRNRLRRLMAG